jgi:rod shape-determining protein MreD
MSELNPRLIARLFGIAILVTLLQISIVSQIPLLDTTVDLSPLAVMSVALLCGSVTGACFGFAVGLFLDFALVQTLGLSSLVLTLVGYAIGRLRELRDPQAALTPMAVGAAATAMWTIGIAIMNILLGVNAPVSLELLRHIAVTILVNTAIAMPIYALVRRMLLADLPEDPRRRRRRAYTTGGLSPLSRP